MCGLFKIIKLKFQLLSRTPGCSYKSVIFCSFYLLYATYSSAQQKQLGFTSNAKPVTHLHFNSDTGKLQFAIVSDLWGGNRPGVFEDAVDKLELLQPEFVMSVGDLIDGKTYDSAVVDEQWNDFRKKVGPLSMPFFYVPGNHDIGNPMMEREFRKRFGSPYYHFVYKNALFLTVNTEDGGRSGISDQQVNYFKKVISDNPGVRWTFIFMHRPVWFSDTEKKEGYEKIESALQGHNYTLFSGHHHTYSTRIQNGNKHFILGSTGGGSDLRGEKFGEYDHVTMVTLGNREPKIINLKLEGVIKEDVVNENTYPLTQTLINHEWLFPIPFVSEHQREKNITAEIVLKNPTLYPLKVSGKLCKPNGYHFTPCNIDLTIEPNSKMIQRITVSKTDNSYIDISKLQSLDILLNGEYIYSGTNYMIPASKKLLLSWKLIPSVLNKTTMNKYNGRDTTGMIALTTPEYLDRKWYWSGPDDGLLKFKISKDTKFVYVVVLIKDEQWVTEDPSQKDLVYLHLEDPKGDPTLVTFSPGNNKLTIEGKGNIRVNDIETSKYFRGPILMTEFKIPINKLIKKDNSARINIGFRDQDNIPDKQYSIIFWKPVWGSAGDYKNSGTFSLK